MSLTPEEKILKFHQNLKLPRKGGNKPHTIRQGDQSFMILKEVTRIQSTDPTKLIVLQKVQFNVDRRVEFRWGYYIIRKDGDVGWGQYNLLIPQIDMVAMWNEAQQQGMLT